MIRANKLMLTVIGLGLAASIGAAHAADSAVLFKIHDVVPVKNADGLVVSCDLGATFYNRTANEISNASLNLVWDDEVVAETIDQEARAQREATRLNTRRSLSRYNTASLNDKSVSLSLKLPPLKPYQQLTLKSKVNTDRCFLLLNEMNINVTNCNSGEGRNNTGCRDLFRFVSLKNPEYYSEFQVISPDEQKAQEQSQLEQQKQEISAVYDDSIKALNDLTANFKITD